MIVYGRNPVREALLGRRAGAVRQVWATTAAARELDLAAARVQIATAEEIEQRCGASAHQGVCADAGAYPYVSEQQLLAGADPFLLALDGIEDPQNLGALCRTAECVGVDGVVIPERRAVEVTPAVCKASAGAVEHLAVAQVRNLADFLGLAKRAGCWCYGAAGEGPEPYDRPDYRGGAVLVMGAEGRGLRPRVAASCDLLVSLPLRGRVGSLNVSAAGAVLMYEMLRRRGGLDSAP